MAPTLIKAGHAVEPRGPPSWIELERIVTLQEAARMKSLSIDSVRRHYAKWIVKLSPRRRGIKLRHVLGIE
jgi:hypothetical protein